MVRFIVTLGVCVVGALGCGGEEFSSTGGGSGAGAGGNAGTPGETPDASAGANAGGHGGSGAASAGASSGGGSGGGVSVGGSIGLGGAISVGGNIGVGGVIGVGGTISAGGSVSGGGTIGVGGSAITDGGNVGACRPNEPGCVLDWVGVFGSTAPSVDGTGGAALFSTTSHMTGHGAYLYVSDANTVRRIEIATGAVQTIAGVLGQPGNVEGVGAIARFGNVTGVATNGATLWVADDAGTTASMRAVDLASRNVWTLAAISQPARGLTYDGSYLYYVTPGTTSALYRMDPTDGSEAQIAGFNGVGFLNGPAAVAQFSSPRCLTAVGPGNLFVADTENHVVRGVDVLFTDAGASASNVNTWAGSVGGYQDSGILTGAQFRRLRGIHATNAALFVADSDNFVVRRIDRNTNQVTTLAGTATVAGHVEGIGLSAQFNKPMDVYFDGGTGDLFILEERVIRRMYGP